MAPLGLVVVLAPLGFSVRTRGVLQAPSEAQVDERMKRIEARSVSCDQRLAVIVAVRRKLEMSDIERTQRETSAEIESDAQQVVGESLGFEDPTPVDRTRLVWQAA